jgi:molybdenum cofactor cytidylyltransferase
VSAPRIAAVVLAAGCSSRFPANKLLQPFNGKPLVRYATEAALGSSATPVVVVTGHYGKEIAAALADLSVVIVNNAVYSDGLSTSLKCGLSHVPAACHGALILLGDMPFIAANLLDRLIEQFEPSSGREICVPVTRGRRGNPVLWGRRFFAKLMAIAGDKGGKDLMRLHEDVVAELEVADDAVLIDIDTPDDLKRLGS